jgi:hypothetical protein
MVGAWFLAWLLDGMLHPMSWDLFKSNAYGTEQLISAKSELRVVKAECPLSSPSPYELHSSFDMLIS